MRLLHNISSLNIFNAQSKILEKQGTALKAISSGVKVNTAADNPNVIAESEKLRLQIRGLQVASQNVQDGVSILQTAEGGLSNIQSVVERVRTLVVKAQSDTNTPEDKQEIQLEINSLQESIGNIAQSTEFNGVKLIDNPDVTDNSKNGNVLMQVGANSGESVGIPTYNLQNMSVKFNPLNADGTVDNSKYFLIHMSDLDVNQPDTESSDGNGIIKGINLNDITLYDSTTGNVSGKAAPSDAAAAMLKTLPDSEKQFGSINILDDMTDSISSIRDKYGALQNRFASNYDDINQISEQMQGADSNITDSDIAGEIMEYSKDNILVQAGTAMLVQSNNFPQDVLKILENVRNV